MSIVINGMDMPKDNSTKNLLIYSDGRVFTGHKDDVNYFAEELPTAQQERQWIPCSERLPEDNQFVLMTIRRMDKHYNHKPFISVGYISWNQSLWWCAHDGDCEPNDVRVDAWMELPEPYRKEGGQE